MKYHLTRAAFAALGCTLLTIVACGSDDDDDAGTSSGGGTSSSSSGDAAAASSSSSGGSSSSSGGSSSSSGGADGGSSSGGGDGGTGPSCQDIDNAVQSNDGRRGQCDETNATEEVQAFVRAACDTEYAAACEGVELDAVATYLACLDAVVACDEADQEPFGEAVDACVDALQNSDAEEDCIGVVLGD